MITDFTLDLPTAHDDGRFISAKVSRIVELIREYDHRLDVMWVPPDMRGPNDPAFAIIERLGDGRNVVAFYVQSEEEFDEGVLERIYLGDNTKHDVQARIEARNKAIRTVELRKQEEERHQYYDMLSTMIRSPKHTFRHDGRKFNL